MKNVLEKEVNILINRRAYMHTPHFVAFIMIYKAYFRKIQFNMILKERVVAALLQKAIVLSCFKKIHLKEQS